MAPTIALKRLILLFTMAPALAASPGCTDGADPASPLVGRWNYDQPDEQEGTNIAQLACPGGFSLALPQIGSIELAETDTGLTGTTDQGCTWTFAVDGGAARLEPGSQTCFNQVIGSSYTLTRWDLSSADQARATESIAGKSHQPGGDCDFILAAGRRSRVADDDPDPTARFLGTWSYATPDATGGNLEQVSCAGSPPTFAPRVGSYSITRSAAGRIRVAADDGCEWTLDVRGNTAQLAPAPQSCPAAGTLAFWSLASDGERAFAVMSGTRSAADASCDFLLATGKLTKVR